MDKKNTLIGLLLIAGAFAMMIYEGRHYEETDHKEEPKVISQSQENVLPTFMNPETPTTSSLPASQSPQQPSNGLFKAVNPETQLSETKQAPETLHTLENEYITINFTSRGGGIKNVVFKEFAKEQDSDERFIFNSESEIPILNIGFPKNGLISNYEPEYKLVSHTKNKILFSTKTPEGIEILRGYSISLDPDKQDPYTVYHETRFVNNSSQVFSLEKLYLNMGTLPPTRGDALGEYLNVGYYNGKKANFIKIKSFSSSNGFFGLGQRSAKESIEEPAWPLVWGSVKNQFFTSVFTPKEPAKGIYAAPQVLLEEGQSPQELEEGITGSIIMELGPIEPANERLFGIDLYIGPKEFTRLQNLGNSQDLVMQFGFFGIISKVLLLMMKGVNSFIPNWGLTIIFVTIIIKLLLWPLTAIQVRSSKRMAKIQEPLKAIREKYKSNPQKIQMETLKLFKENRVNPAAGCLPLLVQLPIFLGLYFMLRTSSELRFAHFLWIHDLSLPDTIAYISNFPINILPLVMGTSMFFQMKLTPAPMTDNTQKRIFQMMPFVFLIFCYNFPSGLILYWTMQNLLTIAQQWITNKMKDPLDDVKPAVVANPKQKKVVSKKKKTNKKG